jgi:hypothetical protein
LLKPDQTIATNPVVVKVTDADVSAVDGLEPGTVLVGDNFNKLTDGMKVQVRKPGSGGHHGGGEGQNTDAKKSGDEQQKPRQQQQQ